MTNEPDRLRRIVRQHLETNRLLGVDFVPVNHAAGPSATAPRGDTESVGTSEPNRATQVGGEAAQGSLSFQPVPGTPSELASAQKQPALDELRARHDAECPHCTQATAHTRTVFGEGNPDADLMFIGEAPGEEEDRTGRPFVGRAGQKLDDIIKAMDRKREEVFIANVLKSRPLGNRTPLPTEVQACSPYLAEQIRIIRPKVIVALGGPATKWLLRTSVGITRLRGQWDNYVDGPLSVPVMPTFHTAYLLRRYTLETRTQVWSDMQAVVARLKPDDAAPAH